MNKNDFELVFKDKLIESVNEHLKEISDRAIREVKEKFNSKKFKDFFSNIYLESKKDDFDINCHAKMAANDFVDDYIVDLSIMIDADHDDFVNRMTL